MTENQAFIFVPGGNIKPQEMGSLGLSTDDFKTVIAILKNRSNCLSYSVRNIITDRTTQNSLLPLLGPKKKTDYGNEITKNLFKHNLKNKLEAEEAAIKAVFRIMASTSASKDNPLKDVILSTNPWDAQSEKQLEYLFREGVCLDVNCDNKIPDRPFVLSIRFEIRILQCLLLNFSWFVNRLYQVIRKLNVESTASSENIIYINNSRDTFGWADMIVKHSIKQHDVSAALEFLRCEYGHVYHKIELSKKELTDFIVEFEIVDNVIGLADTDLEHQGTACVEWRCFNSFKKNNEERQRLDDDTLFGVPKDENSAETDNIQGKKFRSGTSTVTINQSSGISLEAMAKGNENKVFVDTMIKFIEVSIKAINKSYMYNEDCVFSEDQGRNYEDHRDVYQAAICSNPSNIYRVVCHLFANLILPRLRNPTRETRRIQQHYQTVGGTKIITEYGCDMMDYEVPQFAKGKTKISKNKFCACKEICKEERWFDSNREKKTQPTTGRFHNSHRNSAYDFRFFDELEEKIRSTNHIKKPPPQKIMDFDFLSWDENAFDSFNKCYPLAGLHHIYCPDVLMVHRGSNFNIHLKNNKLVCESNQADEIISSQTVNAKEALTDITDNKLKRGGDIVEYLKSVGSVREFSNKTSSVVRELNKLTRETFPRSANYNTKSIFHKIVTYMKNVIPILETLLSIVNIEKLRKPLDDASRALQKSFDGSSEEENRREILKCSFKLFRVMTKFLLRNYNASVAAAINRRGYLSNKAVLTGYRFKSEGKIIQYHESIAAVSSCVAYADFFSLKYDLDEERLDDNKIDETVASLMKDFSGTSKKDENEESETFMKVFSDELLGEADDDDNDSEIEVVSACQNNPLKRSLSVDGDRAKKAPFIIG